MELNKCNRCGAFHTDTGDVCAKCYNKDIFELSTFKSYVEENGVFSVDTIATQTGISQKNVNRFMNYHGTEMYNTVEENLDGSGAVFN